MTARPVRARFNTWAAQQRDTPLVTGQRVITPTGTTGPITGTTVEACLHEGFNCIAIEREGDYLPLIKARLDKPMTPPLDLGSLT